MSSARPVKTYSRRHLLKTPDRTASPAHREKSGVSSNLLSDDDDDDDEPPRKRRTLIDPSFNDDETNTSVTPINRTSSRRSSASRKTRYPQEVSTAPSSSHEGEMKETRMNRSANRNKSPDKIERFPTVSRERTPSPGPSSSKLLSTPKKPKDLSSVFDIISPQKTSRKNAGPLKRSSSQSTVKGRMLTRTRTESSLDLSPTKPDLTPKSHSITYHHSQSVVDFSQTEEETQSPTISSSQQRQREKANSGKTYAGKSRSFLVALPTSSLATGSGRSSFSQSNFVDEDEDDYLRDSYSDLRKRYGVDNSENDALTAGENESGHVEEGLSLYNPLFSITDLRSKGESRRFHDEVSYLFEGLEPSGAISVRRSSAFDIVVKLCDLEFWRKAKAADLLTEIWEKFRAAGAGSGDKVLDCILCCFVALASEDFRDISSLVEKEDFVQTLIRLLDTHSVNDPLGTIPNERLKLSKPEKMSLSRLRDTISTKTTIVHDDCQPSSRLLLSRALSACPSPAFPHLSFILKSMVGDLSSVSNRITAYKSGLPLLPDTSQTSHEKLCLEHIHNCLTILDLYLIEIETPDRPVLSKEDLLEHYPSLPAAFINLITLADIVNRNDFSDSLRSEADHCCELAFRVLINLTNGNKSWSEVLMTIEYTLPTSIRLIMTSHKVIIELSEKKDVNESDYLETYSRAMDHLCLALAFLTNLLQEGSELVFSLHNTMYDSTCEGRRTCLTGCQCANRASATICIVNMYNSLLQYKDEDMLPDLLFLRGHLAVLVGLLLLQLNRSNEQREAQEIRETIFSGLPGPSGSWPRKLDKLLENVVEFSSLFASLTNQIAKNGRGDDEDGDVGVGEDGDEGDTSSFDKNHKAQLGASRANSSIGVVTEVIASLKALRSTL